MNVFEYYNSIRACTNMKDLYATLASADKCGHFSQTELDVLHTLASEVVCGWHLEDQWVKPLELPKPQPPDREVEESTSYSYHLLINIYLPCIEDCFSVYDLGAVLEDAVHDENLLFDHEAILFRVALLVARVWGEGQEELLDSYLTGTDSPVSGPEYVPAVAL